MKYMVLFALVLVCILQSTAAPAHTERRLKNDFQRSAPLDNPGTNQRIMEIARAAQQLDDDHETRLIPSDQHITNKTSLFVCCLHANILDFYLRNVLQTEEKFPHLTTVTFDLARISRDLKGKGCSIKHVNDHEHSRTFKDQFHKLGKKAQTKAIGEIDILFDYLSKYC